MEGRKADADTHLAAARRQNTGNGISGETKEKGSHSDVAVLFCIIHLSCFAYTTTKHGQEMEN